LYRDKNNIYFAKSKISRKREKREGKEKKEWE